MFWLTVVMVLLFLVACILLILTVLIQKPQGGGLAGAFGSGAGSGQTAFGTRTGDALTVATIIMFVFYLATAIGLTYLIKPGSTTPAAPGGQVESAPTAPAETAPAPEGSAPVTNPPATPPATPEKTEPATNPPAAPPANPEQPK
jgi:preprotein translocase subunit SecG